jgi:hypothetical protein
MVNRECLEPRIVKSIAAGRCAMEELDVARRHLADCARCRAAVVAVASGVPGPGETVVMQRAERAPALPNWFKYAAVLVSLLVAGATWRYGAVPKPTAPSPVPEVRREVSVEHAAVLPLQEPSALREDDLPSTVREISAPAPISEGVAAVVPRVFPVTAPQEPVAEPALAAKQASARPMIEDVEAAAVSSSTKRPIPRRREASHSTETGPADSQEIPTGEHRPKGDEYDFGIDDPTPARHHAPAIRQTLE